jgi:predicted acyl esterase
LNYTPLDQLAILKHEPLGQFFFDWIGNPQANDPYWQALNPLSRFENYDLPALHIAGWADIFIEGTFNSYVQAKTHYRQTATSSNWSLAAYALVAAGG